ncbi:MraY family glycosyltransferase [Lysobacter niastensis]|uniref:Glycosyltransferase family 4 protein n=1 Tax=Lysobacter niastensis TaxID=380629 RepID=A0ABS0B7I4_9GAMM|nr:glycosyltransferase family 4 protein [Lysobacter niastensis]MBF6024782.1 glycosyltransferase family 4 protein [Lysobacter niastensis]
MLAWMLLYFVLAAAGTWLARRYALKRDLLDRPDERRSHAVTTPRGGGIAIVAALLVACVALTIRLPDQALLMAAFAAGLVVVAGAGWFDDHRPTSPWVRLGAHAVAATLFAGAILHVFADPWLAGAAAIAILVLVNVWNFMDGINGLAATQTMLVAFALGAFIGGPWTGVALALAAACLGFLPFNFPRAAIFLGDVGSGALGYAVGAITIMASATQSMPWPLLFLPLSTFLVDAGLTLLMRMRRGERWWTAHVQHSYQVWVRSGAGHATVTFVYMAWTLLAILLMLGLRQSSPLFMLCGVVAWYMSSAFAWWLLRRAAQQRVLRNH